MTRLSMTVGAFADLAINTAAAHPDLTRKPMVIPNPWNRVRRDAWLLENAWEVGCGMWVHSPHPTSHAVEVLPPSPPEHSQFHHPWRVCREPGGTARRARPRDSDRRHQAARSRSSFPFRLRPT